MTIRITYTCDHCGIVYQDDTSMHVNAVVGIKSKKGIIATKQLNDVCATCLGPLLTMLDRDIKAWKAKARVTP
jgi:hypothetical protein